MSELIRLTLQTSFAGLAGWFFAHREWFDGTCLALAAAIVTADHLYRYYKSRDKDRTPDE